MRRTGLLHRLIYGSSAKLRTYEAAVLDAVLAHLPAPQAAKLTDQLRQPSYRQRQVYDKVVAFYSDKPGTMSPNLFENRNDDLIVAVVDVAVVPTGKTLCATLYAANGRFFSIEFDKRPAKIGLADGVPVEIKNVSVNQLLDSPN